jgi:hypothetical protein
MALGDGITWNEAAPDDSTLANQIDDYNRDLRLGIRKRMDNEHVWGASQTGTAESGHHRFITLQQQTATPSLVAASGQVGCLFIGSSADGFQLMYENSAGGTYAVYIATAGDLLLSGCASPARSGWTDVSSTYNGKFLRIASSSPLTTAGADAHTHGAGTYVCTGTSAAPTTSDYTHMNGDTPNPGHPQPDHVHTLNVNISGTAASANNVPAYVQMYILKKD